MYHAYSCDSTFSSAEAANALLDDGKLVCPVYPPVNSHRPCQMVAWKISKISFHSKLTIFRFFRPWGPGASPAPGGSVRETRCSRGSGRRGPCTPGEPRHGPTGREMSHLPKSGAEGWRMVYCLVVEPLSPTLLKNHGVKVSWDDGIPNILMEEWKNHVPNHQPVYDDSCWL